MILDERQKILEPSDAGKQDYCVCCIGLDAIKGECIFSPENRTKLNRCAKAYNRFRRKLKERYYD